MSWWRFFRRSSPSRFRTEKLYIPRRLKYVIGGSAAFFMAGSAYCWAEHQDFIGLKNLQKKIYTQIDDKIEDTIKQTAAVDDQYNSVYDLVTNNFLNTLKTKATEPEENPKGILNYSKGIYEYITTVMNIYLRKNTQDLDTDWAYFKDPREYEFFKKYLRHKAMHAVPLEEIDEPMDKSLLPPEYPPPYNPPTICIDLEVFWDEDESVLRSGFDYFLEHIAPICELVIFSHIDEVVYELSDYFDEDDKIRYQISAFEWANTVTGEENIKFFSLYS